LKSASVSRRRSHCESRPTSLTKDRAHRSSRASRWSCRTSRRYSRPRTPTKACLLSASDVPFSRESSLKTHHSARVRRGGALKSPENHPDRTVTFRLNAPKAQEVTLNGSWDNGTNLPMTKDEAGVWSTTIGPLAPQLWGYWFVVDG